MPVDADGNELSQMDLLVRPYPRRVAGTPTSFGYEPDSRVFTLTFEDRAGVTGATEIYLPASRHYPDGWSLTVSDAEGSDTDSSDADNSDADDTWTQEWDPDSEVLRITTNTTGSTHRIEVRPTSP